MNPHNPYAFQRANAVLGEVVCHGDSPSDIKKHESILPVTEACLGVTRQPLSQGTDPMIDAIQAGLLGNAGCIIR